MRIGKQTTSFGPGRPVNRRSRTTASLNIYDVYGLSTSLNIHDCENDSSAEKGLHAEHHFAHLQSPSPLVLIPYSSSTSR